MRKYAEGERLLGVLDGSLCCHRYIAPIISYPHAHMQIRPLVDSPAGRKAVDRGGFIVPVAQAESCFSPGPRRWQTALQHRRNIGTTRYHQT